MIPLPSIWNIVISTIVFVLVFWWITKRMDKRGVANSAKRGIGIFVAAYLISWSSGKLVDWTRLQMYGQEPPSAIQLMLDQMLKDAGIELPEFLRYL
jgi:hypothetical protein